MELTKQNITRAIIVGIIAILVIVLGTSFEPVPAGHEGFKFVQYGLNRGIDQGEAFGEGRHFIWKPHREIIRSTQGMHAWEIAFDPASCPHRVKYAEAARRSMTP